MTEGRRLGIGRVVIRGEEVAFEATESRFAIRAGESVELMLQYEYRESSRDREHVRLILTAELDGEKQGTDEREIEDRQMMVDDKRGFLAVPLRVTGGGERKGRYHVLARYAVGPWNRTGSDEWLLEREGEFVLAVEGARQHRV